MAQQRYQACAAIAAALWFAAAVLYLGSEAVSASAFTPSYSYSRNYISDLGVPVCGSVFDGRPICSPLHLVMNVGFVLQGLCFVGAAVALVQILESPLRFLLLTCATLDGLGLVLLGMFPESASVGLGAHAGYHVLGAFLAIVFGNATAMSAAFAFNDFGLARIHRVASVALPLVGAMAFIMLLNSRVSASTGLVPDGAWERLSVYTITVWELLTAACLAERIAVKR